MDIIERLKQRQEDENTVDESIVKVSDTSEKGLEALSTDDDTDSSKTQTKVNTDSEEGTEDAEKEAENRTSTETKPKKRQKKTDDGDSLMKSSGIMSIPREEKTDVAAEVSNLGEGQKP